MKRLLLTFAVVAVLSTTHPTQFTTWAGMGGICIALARYMGRDVSGVPAIDLLLPLSSWASGYVLASYGSQKVLDVWLCRIDQSLGLSWAVGVWFVKAPALALVCGVVYRILPLVLALLYIALPNRSTRLRFVLSTQAVGLLCSMTYWLCPGAGPVYAFPGWPLHEIRPALEVLYVNAPPNCMPSGHFSWALLVWWFSRQCAWPIQVASAAFLLFTGLATLGMGEHYWIDLIAAIPFAYGIQWLVNLEWSIVYHKAVHQEG
jgi:PAP2 superfamily